MLHKLKKTQKILLIITILGAIIRIISCKWGLPLLLHPDESEIVNNSANFFTKASISSHLSRPLLFCNAILFNIYSLIRYWALASTSFLHHKTDFYVIARLLTVVCGTFMIPLSYLLLEKIKKNTGLIAAALVAFCPGFLRNSFYTTSDIPFTLMLLLIMYYAVSYLKRRSIKNLLLMCLFTALAFSIRYSGIVGCLLIAAVIIKKDLMEHKASKSAIKKILITLIVTAIFTIILSPKLFANMGNTYRQFYQTNNTTNRLGNAIINYITNLSYYFQSFNKNNFNLIIDIFIFIELHYLSKRNDEHTCKYIFPLFLGVPYLLIISSFSIHRETIGLPVYLTLVLITALGIYDFFTIYVTKDEKQTKYINIVAIVLLCLLSLSTLCINLADLNTQLSDTTRYVSKQYCIKNNITKKNTVYDGYSPFLLSEYKSVSDKITITNGKIQVNDNNANDKKYIIVSSGAYKRFYAKPYMYQTQVGIYNTIDANCTLIKSFEPSVKHTSYSSVITIIDNIKYISKCRSKGYSGLIIKIYEINN